MIDEFKIFKVVLCVNFHGVDFTRLEVFVQSDDPVAAVEIAKQSIIEKRSNNGSLFTAADILYAAVSGTQTVFEKAN